MSTTSSFAFPSGISSDSNSIARRLPRRRGSKRLYALSLAAASVPLVTVGVQHARADIVDFGGVTLNDNGAAPATLNAGSNVLTITTDVGGIANSAFFGAAASNSQGVNFNNGN